MTETQAEQEQAEQTTAKPDVPLSASLAELDVIVTAINPTFIGEGDERLAVYEVTLGAVWPEALAPTVLAAAREHRLRLRLVVPDEGVKA